MLNPLPVWKNAVVFFAAILFFLCFPLCGRAQEQTSFFDFEGFDYEEQVAELFNTKKLVPVKNHPTLRRLTAQKVAREIQYRIWKNWGHPGTEFLLWMEKHPDLLEKYLTAIDLTHDDVSTSLQIMRELCTEYPVQVEKFPELAIASAVVWDKPHEGCFSLVGEHHFGAKPCPAPLDVKENFLFYTNPALSAYPRIKNLPWEFLVHIVAHKTSREDRLWAIENYSDREMLGTCYDDVPFVVDEKTREERDGRFADSLLGIEYTLINIRKHGTVCSGRGDFTAGVCRSLGVPVFRCANAPKYSGGHYWVKWLEIQNTKAGKFPFSLEQVGTDEGRQDRISLAPDPHTTQTLPVTHYLNTLVRCSRNPTAYRHGELLMKAYKPLVLKQELSAAKQWELLVAINAVLPGNKNAWQEIVLLSGDKSFEKEYAKHLDRFFPKMVNELLHSPNELPEMTKTLFQCPALKKQEKKSYQYLIAELEASNRCDLVFEAAVNYAQSLQAEQKHQEAFNVLAHFALKHHAESNHIHTVLDRMEKLVDDVPALKESWGLFYDKFLPEASQIGQWPAVFWDYNIDMLNRGLHCYQKCNLTDRVQKTQQLIAKKEKEKADWEAGFQQWLKEETLRQKNGEMK